jgi:hypothetical protein
MNLNVSFKKHCTLIVGGKIKYFNNIGQIVELERGNNISM